MYIKCEKNGPVIFTKGSILTMDDACITDDDRRAGQMSFSGDLKYLPHQVPT